MSNAWAEVSLSDYENHMKSPQVQQLQTLSLIMKAQLEHSGITTLAILGIAGGTGLEHVDTAKIKNVYGIDVNDAYLAECKKRYPSLKDTMVLLNLDISDASCRLPSVDMVIANLLIEYVGVNVFCSQIAKSRPRVVSCVIQDNAGNTFVSNTAYQKAFDGISALHQDIDKTELIAGMSSIGYDLAVLEEYQLPNLKKFLRLDFCLL